MERRLAAILAADVIGWSAWTTSPALSGSFQAPEMHLALLQKGQGHIHRDWSGEFDQCRFP